STSNSRKPRSNNLAIPSEYKNPAILRGFLFFDTALGTGCGPATYLICAGVAPDLKKEWLVRSGMSKRPLCPRPDQPPYGSSGVAADRRWAVGMPLGERDISHPRLRPNLSPNDW